MKFGQQLLSEFNMEWGLDAYVGYGKLKELLRGVKDETRTLDEFFTHLESDLAMVNAFLKKEETALQDQIETLQQTPGVSLRKGDVFDAYNHCKALHRYQQLNKLCFEKIIKKLHKQMGLRMQKKIHMKEEDEGNDSPAEKYPQLTERQKASLRTRCEAVLEQVEASYFLNPERLDLASSMQSLVLLYAEGFCEDEDEALAQEVMDKVWSLDPRSQPRMVDYVDAHFYKAKMRKRELRYACRIIAGNTNRNLARNISRCLGQKSLTAATVERHMNGECNIQIHDNIRGDDVFVFQTLSLSDECSLGQAQMELLMLLHTCRLASAKRITAVIPYLAYQSKKQPMRAFAQMIQKMGADRVLTIDMLAGQIQGFFENMPLDNVKVVMEFVKYFHDKLDPDVQDYASEVCIVSPRSTAVERAREFADEMGCGLATVIRRRKEEMTSRDEAPLSWQFTETSEIVGDVQGKICIVVGCILDEGENMVSVVEELKAAGATRCFAASVHGVLAGDAVQRLNASPVEEVVVTDTICQDELISFCPKLRVIPVAPLLAECIDRIHCEASLGTIMRQGKRQYQHAPRMNSDHDVMQQLEGVDLSQLRQRGSIDHTSSPLAAAAAKVGRGFAQKKRFGSPTRTRSHS